MLARNLSAGLCLLLLPFFFISGPDFYSSSSFKYAWNFGHPLFFALACFYLLSLPGLRVEKYGWLRPTLAAIVFTAALGIGVELVQSRFNRDPNWRDIGRNFIGCLIALCWLWHGKKQLPILLWRIGQLGVLVSLGYSLWALGLLLQQEYQRQQKLPQLFDFETAAELNLVSGRAQFYQSHEQALDGEQSLKVQLSTNKYSGIGLRQMPGNWLGHKALEISFYNPKNEPLKITLRIDDIHHSRNPAGYSDRFNRRLQLPHGWSRWEIPLDDIANTPRKRRLDLSAISLIGIFSSHLQQPQTIYIDNVRLL